MLPILIVALLFITSVISVVCYQKFVVSPELDVVLKRYNEFRAIVATGDQDRIMECIAPNTRSWAKGRLHVYPNFAVPLDHRSSVSITRNKATICPRPQRHFYIIPGGHRIGMVKIDGEWYMDRVAID